VEQAGNRYECKEFVLMEFIYTQSLGILYLYKHFQYTHIFHYISIFSVALKVQTTEFFSMPF